MPLLATALILVPVARAHAGVEYVTRTFDCTAKVATAGQTLSVMAGPNVEFEVWGNSVDLTNPTTGFRFNGPAGFRATIVLRRSGPDNNARHCGFVGSAVVRLDSPVTLTTNANASISFQMPLGDLSGLSISIRAHPTVSTTWTTNGSLVPSSLPCIVKTGSLNALDQDTKLVIQLPPGHQQDHTTCTSNVIRVTLQPSSVPSVDVRGPTMSYQVTGLPAFVTASQAERRTSDLPAVIALTFNVGAIRALTTPSTSTIRFTNPFATSRSASLVLAVTPDAGQGFASAASPNPSTTDVGNTIDFTLTLSAPAGRSQVVGFPSITPSRGIPSPAGVVITWRMTTARCFAQAVAEAPYNATSTFQHFTFPAGQASAIIRVRTVDGAGCTDSQGLVNHIFEAWIGDSRTNPQVTTVTSGPDYTRTTISLRSRQ